MANPNFLILDEPTNDLDLLTIRILEDFLLQFRGCLLIVSHDRAFMDRLVDHLFVFEGEGKVTDFRGTYTERNHLQTQQKEQKTDSSHQVLVDLSSKASESSTSIKKLSYAENIELQQLIKELEELEDEKQQISRIFDNKDLPYDEISLLSEHL
jgi:ABC transporter, ATP-binding protein